MVISTPFIQVYGRAMGSTLDASLLVTSVHVIIKTIHIHFYHVLYITLQHIRQNNVKNTANAISQNIHIRSLLATILFSDV